MTGLVLGSYVRLPKRVNFSMLGILESGPSGLHLPVLMICHIRELFKEQSASKS